MSSLYFFLFSISNNLKVTKFHKLTLSKALKIILFNKNESTHCGSKTHIIPTNTQHG